MLRPSAYEVRRVELREEVLSQYAKMWGIQGRLTHNPAPNPVSFQRDSLREVRDQAYMVAEKSDGVRMLLMLGRYENKRAFSVMIDRKLTIYQVQVYAPRHFFYGSLFDGELVQVSDRLRYLVFDCVSCGGRSKLPADFRERYAIVHKTFPPTGGGPPRLVAEQKQCVTSVDDALEFCAKEFRDVRELKELSQTPLPHDSDGYIFMPVDEPIRKNCHATMYKWKFSPTVDVLGNCCVDGGGGLVPLTVAFPNLTFRLDGVPQDEVAEVKVRVEGDVVHGNFYRTRTDKKSPNSIATIARIVEEIKDAVGLDEIMEIFLTKRISKKCR
jgi:hypothetical protein